MPTLLLWKGHRFLFYSKEIGEPPIFTSSIANQLKVWLRDLGDRERRLRGHEVNAILKVVAEHRQGFEEAWNDHLDIDERQLQVRSVDVTDDSIIFDMMDGRRIVAPLWWYPRLAKASPSSVPKGSL